MYITVCVRICLCACTRVSVCVNQYIYCFIMSIDRSTSRTARTDNEKKKNDLASKILIRTDKTEVHSDCIFNCMAPKHTR